MSISSSVNNKSCCIDQFTFARGNRLSLSNEESGGIGILESFTVLCVPCETRFSISLFSGQLNSSSSLLQDSSRDGVLAVPLNSSNSFSISGARRALIDSSLATSIVLFVGVNPVGSSS